MANAWPPQVTECVGRSRLRWASGFTRRANSCLAIGSDDEIEEIVNSASRFYGERVTAPIFMVSEASAPTSFAKRLGMLGYVPTARTLVLAADTVAVTGPSNSNDLWAVEVTDEATDAWFETYWTVESSRERSETHRAVCRDLLLRSDSAAYVSVVESGVAIAVGQIVVERGWAGVQCMATALGHRRRGAAGVVLAQLAERAIGMGADNMYLAVMHENTGARKLYERCGFFEDHEYIYFTKGTASNDSFS
jgi:N-acetylglutamate synthase